MRERKGKRGEELKKKERKKAGIMMIECLYRIKVFRTYIHTYVTFYLNREQRKGQKVTTHHRHFLCIPDETRGKKRKKKTPIMTSIVSDEIQTNTSEDFGFKSLGQSSILPVYNEKLPYASLENLDISNRKSLFVAYSGGD